MKLLVMVRWCLLKDIPLNIFMSIFPVCFRDFVGLLFYNDSFQYFLAFHLNKNEDVN